MYTFTILVFVYLNIDANRLNESRILSYYLVA